jgi:histone H3/H4
MMTSADALEALSEKVYCLLDKATERTKANRRSTVKPQDL